jgi:hypothetical protein
MTKINKYIKYITGNHTSKNRSSIKNNVRPRSKTQLKVVGRGHGYIYACGKLTNNFMYISRFTRKIERAN